MILKEEKIMVPKIISMNLHTPFLTERARGSGGIGPSSIVIMQNGISNGWQLLKFYHAAIIGAYITEHNTTQHNIT